MSIFSKTKKYRKPSHSIDEKVKLLNKELEKTSVVFEDAPANSTASVYTHTQHIPAVPGGTFDVPDTSGVTDPSTYTRTVGGDGTVPSSGVWANPGYGDNSDLFNNDGGSANGKPILNSPWNGLPDKDGNPSGAAGFGAYPGTFTTKYVTFMDDGTAWWPTNSDTSEAAEALRAYRDKFIADGWPSGSWSNPGWVWQKYWVPFSIYNPRIDAYWPGNSYGFTPQWNGVVKGTESNGYALLGAYMWTGDRAKYTTPNIPASTIVLSRNSLGDADYFPGDMQKNRKREEEEVRDEMQNELDVGDVGLDYIENQASQESEQETEIVANEKAVIDGLGEMANQFGVSTQEFVDSALNYAEEDTSEEDTSDSENTSWFKQATVDLNYASQIALSQLTNRPIEYGNDDIPQEQKEEFISNLLAVTLIPANETKVNYADDNIYRDEDGVIQSNIGPNGEKQYYEKDNTARWETTNNTAGNPLATAGKFSIQIDLENGTIEYEDHAYHNNQSDDKGEVPRETWYDIRPELAKLVDGVSDLIHLRDVFNTFGIQSNHGEMANYPANEHAEIRGDVSKSFSMPLEEAIKLNPWFAKHPQVKEWLNKQQGTTQQQPAQQKVPEKKPLKAPDKPGYKKIITPNMFDDKSDGWIHGSLRSSLEHGDLEKVANEIGVDSSQLRSAVEKADRLEAEWKSAEGADAQIAANKILNKHVKYLARLAKSGSGSVEYFKEDCKLEGNVLSEGWHSPEHVNVDKNERKRWFNPKDIKPEFPEKAPPEQVDGWHPDLKKKEDREPCLLRQLMTRMSMKKGKLGMKEYIKVKEVDLLKNYRMKGKERKEFMRTINSINSYLTRNPSALIHAQQRYPKSDPHLAALNYKMDMQLAAADEYIDKQFPENQRLYNKLIKATQRSIKLTDPKTFKDKKGKMTSINKLMRVDYVVNEYDVTDREVKKKKIKSNKKSAGRFFKKPKKKTKSDILKDKMAVLDKEMKKTMPDL